MNKAAPLAGTSCQEASVHSHETYIPCGAPAHFIIQGRDPCAYAMCEVCADHNVKNRGARYVLEGEKYTLFALPVSEVASATAAPSPVRQFTIDQVLAIYLKAKDEADALGKRHAEEMAPFAKRLDLAKSWMMDYLNKQGLENAKTEHGQCYKSHIMSATVDPEGGWEKVLGYIFRASMARVLDAIEKGQDEFSAMDEFMKAPELALFVRNVNKTTVKELLDQKVEVPGVKIATVTQLNVRRA